MFTIENFIHGIANVTKSLKASICGDSLIVNRICYDYETSNDYEELFAQISLEQIQPIIELLADNYICTDKMLIKNDYIEIAVQSQDRNRPTAFMRLDRDSFEVTEHNYHFITSKASQEYIFALLCSFHNTPDKYEVSSMRLFPKEIITNFEDFCDTFRICTVKVTSPQIILLQNSSVYLMLTFLILLTTLTFHLLFLTSQICANFAESALGAMDNYFHTNNINKT